MARSRDSHQPTSTTTPAAARSGGRGAVTDGVLALQRMAGNAAVGQLIARQPADVKSSRRSVVLWEGKERGQRVKFKSKLVVRGQIPAGNDTLDTIVGKTEAENIRGKSSALETEFIALDGNIWKLTPDGFQKRMQDLGVKATIEFEPFDAAVKTADTGLTLPSIDLMKFNAKLEWAAAGMVFELELSASLSPKVLMNAAERKLLQQFEEKVKDIRKAAADFTSEEAKLNVARQETKRAQAVADDAAKRATKDIPGNVDKGLDRVRGQLDGARARRKAADEAVDAARKQRDQAFRKLDDLRAKDWDAYKRQSKELLTKHDQEIAKLSRKADDLRSLERDLESSVEKHGRRVKTAEFDKANKALRKARKAEEALEKGVKQRLAKVRKLGKEAMDIASRGKSWVFKKIVGPRMLKVLGFLAKAIPILNLISLAADLYEIGKLLWNWDKIKFGIGGGDGGAGGSGSGGKADPSGKGSGTTGGGTSTTQGPGPGTGKDPWDPGTTAPPQGSGSGGTPPQGGVVKPDPQGKSPTGSGTKPDGKDTVPPQGPKVDPSPGGGQPGQGNDPTGTQDTPGGGQGGKPGGKQGGTAGGGTIGGGQGGGQQVPKKPGKQAGKGTPGAGGAAGRGRQAPAGGKGGKGQESPDAKKKPEPKPKSRAVKYVRAIPIQQAAADDVDVFSKGGVAEIAKFTGLNKWTAGKGKGPTTDTVHLTVKHDGQVYRVIGVPIQVTGRTEDVPANTPDRDEYSISLRMEVTKTLRLQGTKLVINAGDELHYTWEGSY